ncbi:MAG: hypothetical protein KZQ96_19715 [Candidatus Thiodiazotropha sp. (ex Lucinoma borealis)]|nr:hypothetical protein [Candidatus Thiodiazotropha sp. (ex Lucinoma borealis)]
MHQEVWNKVTDKRLQALESAPSLGQLIFSMAFAGVASVLLARISESVLNRFFSSRSSYVDLLVKAKIPKNNRTENIQKLKNAGYKVSKKGKKVKFNYRQVLDRKEHEGFLLEALPEALQKGGEELIEAPKSYAIRTKEISITNYWTSIDAWIHAHEQTNDNIYQHYRDLVADGFSDEVDAALAYSDELIKISLPVEAEIESFRRQGKHLSSRLALEGAGLGQLLYSTLIVIFFGPVKRIGEPMRRTTETVTGFDSMATTGSGRAIGETTSITLRPWALISGDMKNHADIWTKTLWSWSKRSGPGTTIFEAAGKHQGTAHIMLLDQLEKLEKALSKHHTPK